MFNYFTSKRKYAISGSPMANTILFRMIRWNNYAQMVDIVKVIQKYCPSANLEHEIPRYIRRIRKAFVCDGWDAVDYFAYHYEKRSHRVRKQFVGEYEKHWFSYRVNSLRSADIYNNKWNTYHEFKKYFRRDVVKVTSLSDWSSLDEFIRNHPIFILKPLDSSMGQGIQKIDARETRCDKSFGDGLLAAYPGGFLAEELIVQDPEIAKIHPQSVNTLRVHTFRLRDGILVYKPYLRIGRGNSVVDNAGAGGIFTSVNEETGAIEKAVDEFCHEYTEHPDTGFPLIGYRIPRWEEAKSLARELATVIEDSSYVGWDLALTEKGWVMIEGNFEAQFVFQMPYQEGFRKDFEEIKRRIKTQR